MPLDPKLADLITAKRQSPPIWDISIEEARKNLAKLYASFDTPTTLFPTEETPVGRLYRLQKKGPLIVYAHGGGWVLGALDDFDNFCFRLAHATQCNVLSVNYRLAPEHTYPAAHEDLIEALKWAAKQSKTLILIGDSVGGNLAACTAIWARDHRKPKIAAQILINPVLDLDCSFPSMGLSELEVLVSRENLEWFYDCYYNLDNDCRDPKISPIYHDNLAKLPPTLILTAEYDTLRDEAEAFSAKLKQAKVKVSCKRYSNMVHGFVQMPALVPQADQALSDITHFINSL